MDTSIGIDIIDIKELAQKIENNPELVNKLLQEQETRVWKIQTIAGYIAAKEAIIKTGYMGIGKWNSVTIINDSTGKPQVFTAYGELVQNLEISISHTKDTAVAVAIFKRNQDNH